MSISIPGRNSICWIKGVKEIANTTGEFYLIKWILPEGRTMHVLEPIDFTPLGPYTIDELYGEGIDTFIRVEQLGCDMRVLDFFKKFGGVFESSEHIQDYELRLKWMKAHTQEYLEDLDVVKQRIERAFADEELSPEVREAMRERKDQKIQ